MGNRFHDGMGWDPIDTLSDGVDAVGDVASSVVEAVPGGQLVTGAVSDFIEGPMRDFARTPLGETIFRAASIVASQSLYVLPMIGYTVGFLAWSVPGLAKGEKFNEALAKEFVYRVEYVASVFAGKAGGDAVKNGVNKMMGNQLDRAVTAVQDMASRAGITPQALIAKTGLNPAGLAKYLGVREDIASYAIEWFNGQNPKMFALINQAYNADGTMKEAVRKAMATMTYSPDSPCGKLDALRKQGYSETSSVPVMRQVFMAQKALCEEAQLNAAIRAANDPNAGNTLGKRIKEALDPNRKVPTPCESYENAKRAGQSAAIIAALKTKCDAYSAEMAAKQATLAASTAVSTAPVAMADATTASYESETNKKSAIAGVVSGFVGAGGALLAGLSAGIAIPVGLSFAAGGAIATKLLSKPESVG